MKYQLSANDNPMLKRFSKPTSVSRGLQVTVKECLCLDFGPSENLCHLHGSQRSGSGFDNLCFRSFTCEPVEKCPSADERITKYKLFPAQTTDTFINKRAIILAWYLEYKKASRNLIKISPPNSPSNQIITKVIWIRGWQILADVVRVVGIWKVGLWLEHISTVCQLCQLPSVNSSKEAEQLLT